MKVYLCALAKNEHDYINEWVAHYVKLGFDKIYIYDNDDKGSKDIYKCIDKQYSKHLVFVDIRGKHYNNIQGKMYSEFYKLHKDMFDWCLFCDIDEFLVGIENIKDFLRNPTFNYVNQIRIKWRLFGDNNLIERDMNKCVMETFKEEVKVAYTRDMKRTCGLPNQGKAIIKGHLTDIEFQSVHFANSVRYKTILKSCLPSGRVCNSGVEIKENYSKENVFLNHYMTKSLSEFVKQKVNRGDAVFANRKIDFWYYWRINKKTKAKVQYLKNLGLE